MSNQDVLNAVRELVSQVGEEDLEVLKAHIEIPNVPDICPEVLSLMTRFDRKRLDRVSNLVEETRQKLGVDYDTIQFAILLELAP